MNSLQYGEKITRENIPFEVEEQIVEACKGRSQLQGMLELIEVGYIDSRVITINKRVNGIQISKRVYGEARVSEPSWQALMNRLKDLGIVIYATRSPVVEQREPRMVMVWKPDGEVY